MSRHECQNCTKSWSDDEIKPIKDLAERIAPGEPVPSGECPECGALTHCYNWYKQRVNEVRVYEMEYQVTATSKMEAANLVAIGETEREEELGLEGVQSRDPMDEPELMDDPTDKVALIPGLSTPEGQKRMAEKLHLRNELDYQCYMMLARLYDEGMLQRGNGEDDTLPDEIRTAICDLVNARVKANDEFIYTVSGRG